jgi:glycosyltransferase involved in cell wall biosynthesis
VSPHSGIFSFKGDGKILCVKMLVVARLTAPKLRDHLLPLVQHERLSQLTIVRENPVPLPDDKVQQVTYRLTKSGAEPGSNSLRTGVGFLKMTGLAFRIARRKEIDAIYGLYLIPYGLLAWMLALITRKKCVISLIGTDLNKDVLEYAYGPLLRWMLRRVDVVTVFDEAARQKLLAHGFKSERVFALPHGVDVTRFIRQPDARQDIDAIFVGYLWPLKEVGRLLQAWQIVLKNRPSAKLVLLGDGPQRAELEAQAASLGIAENITFTGVVDNVQEWLSRAKIFVNLSNQEGVPMAMIEAMLCGLVPVVTSVGGVPSVVRDGENGFLVDSPADPATVASHIKSLLNDPALIARLHDEARAVRDDHSYEAVTTAWTPILHQLEKEHV